MKLGTLILNVTLINWRLFSEGLPDGSLLRSDDDYDTRFSKLKLLSLFDRRFIRDVTFLFNVINGHYDIDISNKLIFCKDRSKNDTLHLAQILAKLMVLTIVFFFLTVLLNHVRESNSIETFKSIIETFFAEAYDYVNSTQAPLRMSGREQ